ncbi:response regulator transcription factor [Gordonia sp. ABSL11-1]|uniref:response regulator transcription factor n=1 Tax=Gordonia sp. ABSL11-1 TaxID=3053924 RepID=UPI002572382D|nr:response regulator transcription factor [Gordonia sp. ABSL11-1]MDL9948343.1 response regulator transcription factor [Gordonia sp. ABSL11-1]
MRVLIVEDEEGLVSALRIALQREGYAVDAALTDFGARERLSVNEYDVALVDVTLPDGDGLQLARQVRDGAIECRSGRDMRIVMLTALGTLPDRVRGLDAGADDYIVKPFALAELTARLRAVLRREVRGDSSSIRVGDITMDTARQIVHRGGREVDLTLKEFAVLRFLMSRPDHVVSAEQLLEHVWDEHTDPFTQTVRVTVGTLRRKLTVDDEEQVLHTSVGRGYRLRSGIVPDRRSARTS